MDMNNWTGIGRLADNVLYTEGKEGSSSRAVGRLIINRPPGQDGQRRYDAIQFVAWGKHADNLAKFTSKGKELGIRGEIRTSSVAPKKEGEEWKNYTEVLVQHISFGRDSTQAKMMKALSVTPEATQQALTNAAAAENQESFAALLQGNPQLLAQLKSVAGVASTAAAPVAEQATEAVKEEDIEVETPFSS